MVDWIEEIIAIDHSVIARKKWMSIQLNSRWETGQNKNSIGIEWISIDK